jgi:hypothetical protein
MLLQQGDIHMLKSMVNQATSAMVVATQDPG